MLRCLLIALLLTGAGSATALERMISEVTDLDFSHDPRTGALVIDLYNTLWEMPLAGGLAEASAQFGNDINRPVVSPDGRWLAFERCDLATCSLQLYDRDSDALREILAGPWTTRMPAFSADSARIAFVSDKDGSDDIWEDKTLGGGLKKRSFAPGDERFPTFARHADQLAWVAAAGTVHRLMLATGAGTGAAQYISGRALRAPSFRPDGTVLTVFEGDDEATLRMVINDGSGLVKTLLAPRRFHPQRPVWLDRHEALVSVDGKPQRLVFGERGLIPLRLAAFVSVAQHAPARTAPPRPTADGNFGTYVLRVGRSFDSVNGTLTGPRDIVIEHQRIQSIGPPRTHANDISVLDYSSFTAIPGLVALVSETPAGARDDWLASGATSVVCVTRRCQAGATSSGPTEAQLAMIDTNAPADERVAAIREARAAGLNVATARPYPDVAAGANLYLTSQQHGPVLDDYSALLDAADAAVLLAAGRDAAGIAAAAAHWRGVASRLLLAVAGDPSRFRTAISEFCRARGGEPTDAAAGLRALTLDAALTIGAGADLGHLAPGKQADIVLVAGDPLALPEVLQQPIAVLQRGRFFTPAGLNARQQIAAGE